MPVSSPAALIRQTQWPCNCRATLMCRLVGVSKRVRRKPTSSSTESKQAPDTQKANTKAGRRRSTKCDKSKSKSKSKHGAKKLNGLAVLPNITVTSPTAVPVDVESESDDENSIMRHKGSLKKRSVNLDADDAYDSSEEEEEQDHVVPLQYYKTSKKQDADKQDIDTGAAGADSNAVHGSRESSCSGHKMFQKAAEGSDESDREFDLDDLNESDGDDYMSLESVLPCGSL